MKNVLCVLPVEDRHKEKLENAAKDCVFTYVGANEVTDSQVQSAEIILGCVNASMIKESKKLELLQLNTAGTDPYIVPGVLGKNTVLVNATGAYSKAVAEHALAMYFALHKKLHLYRDAQKKSCWTDFGTVSSITDATVLVVGLGDIGCHFARLCKVLGAYVIGIKRRASDKPGCVDELYTFEALSELLPRADLVFSILPGMKSVYHLYNADLFKKMKSSAIFINCGRGGAVDQEALYEAITNDEIAAAGIDVTEPEPLSETSPLWGLDNLLITPHVSGYYHLPETFERIVDIAADNLYRFTNGLELRNVVDFATGYKK